MARLTFNIELDSKPDRNGLTAVMVRIHQKEQKPARVLTDVKIENAQKHWALLDKKRKPGKVWGKWVVRHPDSDALNEKIKDEYERIEKTVKAWNLAETQLNPESPGLTPKAIADRFRNRLSESYFDLTAQVLEECKAQAFRTYTLKSTAVNLFSTYAGEDLPFDAVTAAYLEAYRDYMKNKYVSPRTGKRLAASSINQYMESLATVHKDVLKLKGFSNKKAAQLSPFLEIDPLPAKSAYRSKFDEQDIENMEKNFPTSNRRVMRPVDAFSIWMLSHLLAGARYRDVLMLRYMHFEKDEAGLPVKLTYSMNKTGNTVSIPILDEARNLLMRWWKQDAAPTDYLLPCLSNKEPYAQYVTRKDLYEAPFEVRQSLNVKLSYWNGQVNKVLDEIGKKAGLKGKLRMHNARHSFADLARRIMQEDGTLTPLDITLMLGQSDFRMTMKYIEELSKQDAAKPMTAVFGRKKKAEKLNQPG